MIKRKRVLGLFLIICSIFAMIGWENWGKDRFLYDEILVLRDNVEKGTVITEDMLTVCNMEVDESCLLYAEKENVIGMQATAFLHKGVPLFKQYFQEQNLIPDENKGRYGLCIPSEWIASKPTKLARGDKVFFLFGSRLITAADVVSVTEDGAVEIVVEKNQAAAICETTKNGNKLALAYQ